MTIDSFQVGQEVKVQINDVKSFGGNGSKWVDGIVTDKWMSSPKGSGERPFPMIKVKYIHTYYRKLKDNYNGIVWIGEEGEYYDKENESLFFYDNTISAK